MVAGCARKLDDAVLAAYGWPKELSDQDICTTSSVEHREARANAAANLCWRVKRCAYGNILQEFRRLLLRLP